MSRRCFFIFEYENDWSRAKQVNDLALVGGTAPAGFDGAAAWKVASREGYAEVNRLIDEALPGASATIVLIGANTADLEYVDYAIEQSIKRQSGIVGVFVHDIPDENGQTSAKGRVPYEKEAAEKLEAHGYDTHDWDPDRFAEWVETAATEWKLFARPEPLTKPGA